MSQITVSLTDVELEQFVSEVVEQDALDGPSEYVLHLIREDRRRRAGKKKLEALLLEGLEGDPIPVNAEFWAEMRREFEADHPSGTGS